MRNIFKHISAVEVQIENEYYIVAKVDLADEATKKFKCELSIEDKDAGFSVNLDKSPVLYSTFESVNDDVIDKLTKLINADYFANDIKVIKNWYECMEEMQKVVNA